MKRVKIAIIGGTGVYDNPFLEELAVGCETGYGKVLFIAAITESRSGPGPQPRPRGSAALVNYRAHRRFKAASRRGDFYRRGRLYAAGNASGKPGGHRPVYRFH